MQHLISRKKSRRLQAILCLQCWLIPNVYKLLKILQQNSVIYILVEVIKPLWNSHCKERISLNIGPFVWYNFDFTLRISLAFISEATGVTIVTTQPTHHTMVGYLIDCFLWGYWFNFFFTRNHNSSNYSLFVAEWKLFKWCP